MKTPAVTATVAFFSALGAACGGAPHPVAREAPHPMSAAQALSAPAAASAGDVKVARVLRRELAADEALAGESIGVDVVDGVATLEGRVTNRRAVERALKIAPVVRGVRAVINHIELAPSGAPDDALEMQVASALGRDPALAHQHIAAKAHDGVVRLTGDVDNSAAKRVAIDDVLAIPGVTSALDLIAVNPSDDRDDAAIVNETQRVLRDDPWLDGSHVRVIADHGTLALSGSVGNEAELARAESDARTVCPPRLDVTALEIDPSPSDDGTMRAHPTPSRRDDELAQSVIAAYTHDNRLRLFVPGTDVRNGVVILTGIAPTDQARRLAIEDAGNVPGVADVRSAIQVRSAVVASDDVVRNDVYNAIKRDPELAGRGITVGVLRGRVLLRGSVRTPRERMAAIATASSIPGVSDVVDVLDVRAGKDGDGALGRAEAQAPSPGSPSTLLPTSSLPAYWPATAQPAPDSTR